MASCRQTSRRPRTSDPGVEFPSIMWLIPIPPKPWAPWHPFVPVLDTSFIFPAFWIACHHGDGWWEGRGRGRQIWIDPLQDASWSAVAMGARFLDKLDALKDPIVKEICHVLVDFFFAVVEWRNEFEFKQESFAVSFHRLLHIRLLWHVVQPEAESFLGASVPSLGGRSHKYL